MQGNDFLRQRSQLSGVLFTQDRTGRGIPGYFLGYSERTGASFSNGSGSEASWIYDPIDGAYHYLMGLPLWSSSLALVVNGETRAAFVYDPVLDEMFTAVKGEQASLNGREIRSSDRKLLEAAVVATTMPSFKFDGRDATDATIASIQKVVPAVFSLRIMASSSLQLAYVAAGRLDAYWSMDGDVEDWLAGALLAEEAGALVTNAESGNFTIGDKSIVASGQNLSTQIAHLLKKKRNPIMADRKYGEPAPPTSERISGADWYGQELLRKEYSNTLFVDIDLTEVQSSGCVFNECTFRRARFNASIHKDSAFVNCTFVSCNFFDSKFLECKLLGSMFDDCQFHHMQVIGGDWGFVGLPGADLSRASLLGIRLREADLTGARCQGGTIRDTDLSGAWLHSADFSECDLRGSDLSSLEPENVQLKGAIITIDQTIIVAQALGFEVRVD